MTYLTCTVLTHTATPWYACGNQVDGWSVCWWEVKEMKILFDFDGEQRSADNGEPLKGNFMWMLKNQGSDVGIIQGLSENLPVAYVADWVRQALCDAYDIEPRGSGMRGLHQACLDVREALDLEPTDWPVDSTSLELVFVAS